MMVKQDDTLGKDPSDGDPLEAALDAGLREAFGANQPAGGPHASIINTLQETMGIQPRILLPDAPDDESRITLTGHGKEARAAHGVGRYQIAGEIARGGVGIVMKGRDPDLGRDVAIKIIRDEHLERSGMVSRFVEEAQIAAQLQHPGIPAVYELGLAQQRPFFSMKLIKGRTLAHLLRDRKDPGDEQQRLIGIFEQICQAVAYAHAKAVVHRDLKPSNIMVGTFGEVQVVDWGLAKVLPTGGLADEQSDRIDEPDDASMVETIRSGSSAAQSIAGSVLGTPAYMPPEQARGEVDRLTERSDVFSLGAILCEILTGHAPFTGDRNMALSQARHADLESANARLAACDADTELIDIAKQCLSPHASERPRDAGVVATKISGYLASLAERVRASELAAAEAAAVAKQERRARRVTLALGTIILLAAGFIIGGALWLQNERQLEQDLNMQELNASLDDAANLLGQATAARVGQTEPWLAAGIAFDQISDMMDDGPIDPGTRQRAEELIVQYENASRDRSLIDKLEEVVIIGATHDDKHSWIWMEEELRGAFRDYGIDITEMSQEMVAEKIRESELAPYLTDGLELWMGTVGHLYGFGVQMYPPEQLMTWIDVLYKADPDPFAAAVRKLVYARFVTVKDVNDLMDSVDFAEVRPRTLAWLASAAYRSGDVLIVKDIFRRALLLYPDDLMLNFDFAYNMIVAREYHRAIRAYERCLAIRPQTAGIWRGLGVALRHVDDHQESIDALEQSIKLQPDHAPTYVDLGITWEAMNKKDKAREAYEQALTINADLVKATQRLNA
ncbi:MAG: protein kinase domain-containing protein, partial [Phycisphaerae bacterium]